MAVISMVAEKGSPPALFGIGGIFGRAAVHHERYSESRDGSEFRVAASAICDLSRPPIESERPT
jgi:hypothetical protein